MLNLKHGFCQGIKQFRALIGRVSSVIRSLYTSTIWDQHPHAHLTLLKYNIQYTDCIIRKLEKLEEVLAGAVLYYTSSRIIIPDWL